MKMKAAITSQTLVPPVKLHRITSSATAVMRKHLLNILLKKIHHFRRTVQKTLFSFDFQVTVHCDKFL